MSQQNRGRNDPRTTNNGDMDSKCDPEYSQPKRGRSDHRHGRGGKYKAVVGERGKQVVENIDENSPVIKCFRQYAVELDAKHDKYERIVKISRDITIESKRIIFLLHTVDSRENQKGSVLEEAASRLAKLEEDSFKNIARELKGEDPYHFLRAYTAGLQEYVEAVTFYYYLKSSSLQNWTSIQEKLSYTGIQEALASTDKTARDDDKDPKAEEKDANLEEIPEVKDQSLQLAGKTLVPPTDYILGVADLTGELMRKCINNLGLGQIESCYKTCAFVREIHNGFLRVGNSGPKEMTKKMYTLRQSLGKMENACYTIHVRGSEIPKHMLADVFSASQDEFQDEDEGFY